VCPAGFGGNGGGGFDASSPLLGSSPPTTTTSPLLPRRRSPASPRHYPNAVPIFQRPRFLFGHLPAAIGVGPSGLTKPAGGGGAASGVGAAVHAGVSGGGGVNAGTSVLPLFWLVHVSRSGVVLSGEHVHYMCVCI